MEVNQEIQVLGNFLKDAVDVLGEDGRLAIITFHSLEDRLVKTFFRNGGYLEPIPKNMMGQEEKKRQMKEIMNKIAGGQELKENNRSRSARLRVGLKL